MNEQEETGAPAPTGGEPAADGAAGQEDAKPRARRARGRRGGRRHKSAAARAAARAATPADAAGEVPESPSPGELTQAEPQSAQSRKEPQPAREGVEAGPQAPRAKGTARRRRSGRGRKAVAEGRKTQEAASTAPPVAVPEQPEASVEVPATGAEAPQQETPQPKPRSRRRRSGRGRQSATPEPKTEEAAPLTPTVAESGTETVAALAESAAGGEASAMSAAAPEEEKPRGRRRRSGRGRKTVTAESKTEEAAPGAPQPVSEEPGVGGEAPAAGGETAQEEKPRTRRRRASAKPEAAVAETEGASASPGADDVVVEMPRRKQILVSSEPSELRVAVVEDGRLAEILIERPSKTSCLGNIYKGKVDNVLAGMDAAFVDIGLDKNGFLSVDEVVVEDEPDRRGRRITQMLRSNQEILVQVSKDPMGNKGARLTTKLSLAGRYLVYVPNGSGVGVSRRLKQDERDRLRDLGKSLDARNAGLIARTAAEGIGIEELQRDLRFLSRLGARLKKKVDGVSAPGLLYAEVDVALETVRDLFNESCESVVCDTVKRQKEIVAYLDKVAPELKQRVELYTGQEPLFAAHGIEEQISRALERRVNLPSGGNLVIDHTEALTVIDVNTGRYTGGKGLEDTTTKTNLEAAREVVRQLRLRDIGGIIVVDFIDMARAKNREAVLNRLEAELETDRTKTYVVELSPLGLVEMTRQNTTDGARGILTKTCPLCQGKARILSEETVALSVERSVRERARASQNKAMLVEVNGDVAERLMADGRLKRLEKETGKRVFLESSQALPVDSFSIVIEGTPAEVEKQRIPVHEGQEVEVEVEYALTYSPRDAVGYVDGYMVIVEGGRECLGTRRRVRVVTAMRTGAHATLVSGRAR